MQSLNHFDAHGNAHMVDVGAKATSARQAIAEATVRMQPETLRRILDRTLEKGDVFGVARIAGIMAAKKTGELIPLCHPLSLSHLSVDFSHDEATSRVVIRATVRTVDRTGVEMEAMTAASVAALTLYDMCKAIDRGMVVEHIQLIHKSGGKSGTWERNLPPPV